MKTMIKAIEKANRSHKGEAEFTLDYINSYPGFYNVAVTIPGDCTAWYVFETVDEFITWEMNVIFD